MHFKSDKQLLTIDEAAEHFRISRRTFSTIINNNPVKFLQAEAI
jgi:5-bromo-4-chloroindolyl phosphate hydrolysis protein